MLLLTYNTVIFADCNSDLKKVDAMKIAAATAEKARKYSEAQKIYKRGARKVAVMKYSCTRLSLTELSKRERYFRTSAKSIGCSTFLEKGMSYTDKAKSASRARKYRIAAGFNKSAIEQYNLAIKSCANTLIAKQASKMLAQARGISKTNLSASSKKVYLGTAKKGRTSTARKKPGYAKVATSSIDIGKKRNRANKCFVKKLRHIIRIENDGARALKKGDIDSAANYLSIAADRYDKESAKCANVTERLGVMDRSKYLTQKVQFINQKYNRCGKGISEAQSLARQAVKEERLGDYQFAQETYTKLALIYDRIPKGCTKQSHIKDKKRFQVRAQLLACQHYISGIKQYNLAFQEMSSANREKASDYYTKAIKFFSAALNSCQYTEPNIKIVRKLKKYSMRSVSRNSKKKW